MILFMIHRKWKRTFLETKEHAVVLHLFKDYYLIRMALKKFPKYRRIKWCFNCLIWVLVDKKDFLTNQ